MQPVAGQLSISGDFCHLNVVMKKIIKFLKDWSLPLGIMTGIMVYAAFHFISFLNPLKPAASVFADHLVPLLLFVMLFFIFCKVDPKEMKVSRWHLWLAAIQIVSCAAIAIPLHFFPDFSHADIAEGAMVCLICPTATAAAVITGKLGGNETSLTTYTILSNLIAAVVIPLFFPLVAGHSGASFFAEFIMILKKICLISWQIRCCLISMSLMQPCLKVECIKVYQNNTTSVNYIKTAIYIHLIHIAHNFQADALK